MKKQLFFFLLLSLLSVVGWCQAPQQFNYQAVVRNSEGDLVAEEEVPVTISILQGSATGEVVYTEFHQVRTNQHGLFTLTVGNHPSTDSDDDDDDSDNDIESDDDFDEINWKYGPYFLKVEIDPEGDGEYLLITTQQILSVPYALYANIADSVRGIDLSSQMPVLSISNDTIFLSTGGFAKLPDSFSGDYNDLINKPEIPTNVSQLNNDANYLTQEVQALSISNDTIYLTNGGFVKLPAGFDGNYNSLTNLPTIPVVPTNVSEFTNDANYLTQEVQALSISNDTIYLTNGGFVKLPAGFDGNYNSLTNLPTIPVVPTNVSEFTNDANYLTQEVQALSISNDTIYLTNGGFVKLPAGFDGNYNSLTNLPEIPTNVSQLNNDANYLTQEVQALSISNDTIYLTNGGFVKLPAGFDGNYNSLTNLPIIPVVPTNVSEFTNDANYLSTERQTIANVLQLGNSANNMQIKNLSNPTDAQDAVTVDYLDSTLRELPIAGSLDLGSHNVFVIDACESYQWNGTTYTEPGTYTYNYSNGGGYFSVDTLKLRLRHGSHHRDYATATGSYTWHGTLYTASGEYVYSYHNHYGCPSTDTLHLTINAGGGSHCTAYRYEDDTAAVTACEKLNWYGSIIRKSGVYEHSLGTIAQHGCDSVLKLQVNIIPGYHIDTAIRTESPITWRGNVYNLQGDYTDTLTAANGCDSIYTLHLMIGGNAGIGATKGLFSVSEGLQVRFAQGNLQYQSSSNTWRFAESQYDKLLDEYCIAPYDPKWADKFHWATSGYHNAEDEGCINYQPWSSSIKSAQIGTPEYENNQYGYGPSKSMTDTNLVGTSVNYDWGMYHAITNGGNGAGLWRLMSKEEWNYLLYERPNADKLRLLGNYYIDYYNNPTYCILLPDDWVCPSDLILQFNSINRLDSIKIKKLESSGAIFLYTNKQYWTSTSGGAGAAYAVIPTKDSIMVGQVNRCVYGYVRLVQNQSAGISDCHCTYFDTTIVSDGSFSWHGQTYTESGDYIETLVNNAGCDSIINLSLSIVESGELIGLFSVSATKQVKFSKGNLQYNAAIDVWRFANHQYEFIGGENKNIAADYDGWIDLFAWATSGYHNPVDIKNRHYHPWSAHQTNYGENSYYGPSSDMSDMDLVNTSVNYDWGVYNAISNGGNEAGVWRTLTKSEWYYVTHTRDNAENLYNYATVNGVKGFILLPDNWICPDGIVIEQFDYYSSFSTNVYNISQWSQMEDAGAVFFPSAGVAYSKTSISYIQESVKDYWSSTHSGFDRASAWDSSHDRAARLSVRLVKDVVNP